MFLPDAKAIDEQAQKMGLAGADGRVLPGHRAAVVNVLVDAEAEDPAKQKKGTLLSRNVIPVTDGKIIVDITHVPNP